jgi:hypothetical protein
MVPLSSLILPIVLSALFVFIASFLLWAVLPWHRSDWRHPAREEVLMQAIRDAGLERGQYTFPAAAAKPASKRTPEEEVKATQGPLASLVVLPQPNISRSLALALLYYLVISLFVAYVTSRTLASGAEYLQVFRITGTIATLAYAGAIPLNSIWFGHTWSFTWKSILDGLVHGLLTAGVFGWLWPGR